jgi:hypothetical protein
MDRKNVLLTSDRRQICAKIRLLMVSSLVYATTISAAAAQPASPILPAAPFPTAPTATRAKTSHVLDAAQEGVVCDDATDNAKAFVRIHAVDTEMLDIRAAHRVFRRCLLEHSTVCYDRTDAVIDRHPASIYRLEYGESCSPRFDIRWWK